MEKIESWKGNEYVLIPIVCQAVVPALYSHSPLISDLNIITHTFKMTQITLREIRPFLQGHLTSKGQHQDLNLE